MVGEFVLKDKGIEPHKDLKLIQNIDFANVANAFASGTGDYVQLFEPTASVFEKEGKGHIVASFGKESGSVPYTDYMAKESFLKKNKDTLEKFVRAIYKAAKWVEENDPKEVAEVVQPFFEDVDVEILASSIERYQKQGSFGTDLILNEEGWNHLQDILEEAGELPKRVDYKTLVNTSIAEKALQNK